MQFSRILGIDYGDVRIGLAITDLMQVIASPLEVLPNKDINSSINKICEIIKNNEVSKIVIGLPLNMDGSEGTRAVVTKEFAKKLAEKTSIEIVFQDERLSSVEAEDMLIEADVSREERKKIIDKVAASIILESYINRSNK